MTFTDTFPRVECISIGENDSALQVGEKYIIDPFSIYITTVGVYAEVYHYTGGVLCILQY